MSGNTECTIYKQYRARKLSERSTKCNLEDRLTVQLADHQI